MIPYHRLVAAKFWLSFTSCPQNSESLYLLSSSPLFYFSLSFPLFHFPFYKCGVEGQDHHTGGLHSRVHQMKFGVQASTQVLFPESSGGSSSIQSKAISAQGLSFSIEGGLGNGAPALHRCNITCLPGCICGGSQEKK